MDDFEPNGKALTVIAVIWAVFCGLIALAFTAGLIWLIVEAAQWIGRH